MFGLVAPGYQMARIAAARVLGAEGEVFAGADMSTKLKLLGVEVGSIGDAHATTAGARVYSFFDQRKEVYKKLVVDAEGKKLIGAVLVGDTSDYSMWHQTVANAMALPENPETMLFPAAAASAGAPPTNALAALPATAQVCSCNNVSKGGICSAIEAGCTTVGALKTKTKAGTTCGGCTPLVTQILNAELKKRGVNVNTSMCEHFPYTRQQLFHLVRIGELKTFEDLLARHGRGLGCDICKPAVASIMASCWNEFVLKKRHAALQDTNDYFLANMQKDGTYSVVPQRAGWRDHARETHRHRPGGEEVRPVHQDHRRPAHRPVRRAGAPAAADLARAHRCRHGIRPRLRQGAAHGEELRRLHAGAATACRTASASRSISRIATRACARLTRSSSRCRAARASAPKRRARTWASSPSKAAGTSTSPATAA